VAVTLEEIVNGVNSLPSLPGVALQVIRITDDPYSTVRELNEAILQDQTITAQVLRLSNSAYYGYPRRIATVSEAIGILGFTTIRDLVMAASVHNILSREVKGYQIATGDIWRHSITCAMTSRAIARRVRYPEADRTFIAGLMHDIGKVVLNIYVADAYNEIIRRMKEERLPFAAVEEEVLGFTHAAVGARVAERWNLHPDHVEAIACHHTPLDAKQNPKLAAIVHIADAVCMTMGIGLGGDGLYYPFVGEVLGIFGLSEQDMERIMSELAELMGDAHMFA
jgi:putative nucleotidyltransferase with HDIG domain